MGGILMFIGFIVVLLLLVEDKSTYGFIKTKEETDKLRKGIFSSFIISLLFVLFFHRILRSIFSPFMALFVQENLGSVSGVASVTGFINGGVAFITAMSGIIFGKLGEKYNKKMMLIVSMSAAFLLSILVSLTGNLTAFACFYIILFLFIGGVEPLITSITAEKTAPENRGVLFGYQGTVGSIGMLASPVLGTFISVNFSIKTILILLPVICIVILGLSVKLKYNKNTTIEAKQSLGESI
jgi:DHA1 family multidrug resistance protein-like MFS transporter